MQNETVETSPTLSRRGLEEKRLRKETIVLFSPAARGFFVEKRKELVEQYVRDGLKKFDEQEEINATSQSLKNTKI